jgi:hypothetical protein
MIAAKYRLDIEHGATFKQNFVWMDATRVPINLTGCTARMQIRQKFTSDEFYVELTTENGKIVLGGTTGTVDLIMSPTDTESILTNGVYDLEVIFTNGDVVRLLYGAVNISKNVTR